MAAEATTPRRWRLSLGIAVRTALFAWLVAVASVLLFAAAVIPEQQRAFLQQLRSKSVGQAASLHEVAAGAAVSEDYTSVVDAAMRMLRGDPAIEYIVLTRSDGFSLVHLRSGWRMETLGPEWRPTVRRPAGAIVADVLGVPSVYQFSEPFNYSGLEWGWIHIGLSVGDFNASVASSYRRTALFMAVSLLLGLIGSLIYARQLVRPLLAVERVVARVADGDLTARAAEDRGDELGRVASAVNRMTEALLKRDRALMHYNETLEQRVLERTRALEEEIRARTRANEELAATQQRLIEVSRAAGMAEVATGVLHNVGNVLNSVNVSATLLRDQISRSRLATLQRAVGLLEENRADLARYLTEDPKGALLQEFLPAATQQVKGEHEVWRAELDGLAKNIEHIKEIVAMQQSYARVSGVAERVSPVEMFEDALRINQGRLPAGVVEIVRGYETIGTMVTHKHRVLQILVNLISNAIHALEARPPGQRRLTLELKTLPENRLAFVVRDNGAGIAAENRLRIFSHGFTTRRDGHGFGLHSGAIAAKEMGGSLTVASDGPGHGATFTLELPVQLS